MKEEIPQERKWIHDMRSHLGVINAYLMTTKHLVKKVEEKQLLKNSEVSFKQMVALMEKFSENLLIKENNPRDEFFFNCRIAKGQKGILVIDDDSHVRHQFNERLTKKGIKVIALEKGEDLLRHRLDYEKITSAIIDFNFNNSALDGFDIVEYLMTFHIKTIHLCTSQYDDPLITKKAKELGVTSIISKPLNEAIWALF